MSFAASFFYFFLDAKTNFCYFFCMEKREISLYFCWCCEKFDGRSSAGCAKYAVFRKLFDVCWNGAFDECKLWYRWSLIHLTKNCCVWWRMQFRKKYNSTNRSHLIPFDPSWSHYIARNCEIDKNSKKNLNFKKKKNPKNMQLHQNLQKFNTKKK